MPAGAPLRYCHDANNPNACQPTSPTKHVKPTMSHARVELRDEGQRRGGGRNKPTSRPPTTRPTTSRGIHDARPESQQNGPPWCVVLFVMHAEHLKERGAFACVGWRVQPSCRVGLHALLDLNPAHGAREADLPVATRAAADVVSAPYEGYLRRQGGTRAKDKKKEGSGEQT